MCFEEGFFSAQVDTDVAEGEVDGRMQQKSSCASEKNTKQVQFCVVVIVLQSARCLTLLKMPLFILGSSRFSGFPFISPHLDAKLL